MSIERPVNGPVPLGFDELRADRPPHQFLERRVEPLDVPDLEAARPRLAPGAIRSSASATVRHTGFSTSTGTPLAGTRTRLRGDGSSG